MIKSNIVKNDGKYFISFQNGGVVKLVEVTEEEISSLYALFNNREAQKELDENDKKEGS